MVYRLNYSKFLDIYKSVLSIVDEELAKKLGTYLYNSGLAKKHCLRAYLIALIVFEHLQARSHQKENCVHDHIPGQMII